MLKNTFLKICGGLTLIALGASSPALADREETINFEIGPISIEFNSWDPSSACPNLLKDWEYPRDNKGNFYSPRESEKLELSTDGKSITGKTTTRSAAELSNRGILPELNDQSVLMNLMLQQCQKTFPEHSCTVDPADYLEAIIPDDTGQKTFESYCPKPERNGDQLRSPLLRMTVLFSCVCTRFFDETQSDRQTE